jgi:hypothetical protein
LVQWYGSHGPIFRRRHGVIRKAEVAEEMKQRKEKSVKAR